MSRKSAFAEELGSHRMFKPNYCKIDGMLWVTIACDASRWSDLRSWSHLCVLEPRLLLVLGVCRELQRQGHPNVVVALAGNKTDLTNKRQVQPAHYGAGSGSAPAPRAFGTD